MPYTLAGQKCSDVMVVFARGSGQPQGRSKKELKEKPQLVAFFNELKNREPSNIDVEYDELIYDAEGDKRDFVEAEFSWFKFGNYRDSVAGGIYNLGMKLEMAVQDCPDQKIVLGGYSQGAHVTGDTLSVISNKVAENITYVGLFGDPKFKVNSWAARGNFEEKGLGSAGGVLEQRDEFPEKFKGKVESWCRRGDGICENSWYRSVFEGENHGDVYQHYEIPIVALNASMMLQQQMPEFEFDLEEPIIDSSIMGKLDLMIVLDGRNFINTRGNVSSIRRRTENIIRQAETLGSDLRIGLVAQHGYNRLLSRPENTVSPLSSDITKFRIATHFLYSRGKNAFLPNSALQTALAQEWRPEANKVIMLISRVQAGPDEYTGDTMTSVINNAKSQGVSVFTITPDIPITEEYTSTYNRLSYSTNGLSFYRNIYVTNNAGYMLESALRTLAADRSLYTGNRIQAKPGQEVNFNLSGYNGVLEAPDVFYAWHFTHKNQSDLYTDEPIVSHTYNRSFKGLTWVKIRKSNRTVASMVVPVDISHEYEPPKPPDSPQRIKIDILESEQNNVLSALSSFATLGITQEMQGSQTIHLSWEPSETDENTAPASLYRIYKSNGELLGLAGPNQTEVTITDVPLDADLNLTMRAASPAGDSRPEPVSEIDDSELSENPNAEDDEQTNEDSSSHEDNNSDEHSIADQQRHLTTNTTYSDLSSQPHMLETNQDYTEEDSSLSQQATEEGNNGDVLSADDIKDEGSNSVIYAILITLLITFGITIMFRIRKLSLRTHFNNKL